MSKAFTKLKDPRYLGLDDIIPFGRYSGYSVLEIVRDRPVYIDWLIKNTDLKFYQSVHEELARQDYKKAQAGAVPKSYLYAQAYQGVYDKHGISYDDPEMDFEDWCTDVPF